MESSMIRSTIQAAEPTETTRQPELNFLDGVARDVAGENAGARPRVPAGIGGASGGAGVSGVTTRRTLRASRSGPGQGWVRRSPFQQLEIFPPGRTAPVHPSDVDSSQRQPREMHSRVMDPREMNPREMDPGHTSPLTHRKEHEQDPRAFASPGLPPQPDEGRRQPPARSPVAPPSGPRGSVHSTAVSSRPRTSDLLASDPLSSWTSAHREVPSPALGWGGAAAVGNGSPTWLSVMTAVAAERRREVEGTAASDPWFWLLLAGFLALAWFGV